MEASALSSALQLMNSRYETYESSFHAALCGAELRGLDAHAHEEGKARHSPGGEVSLIACLLWGVTVSHDEMR